MSLELSRNPHQNTEIFMLRKKQGKGVIIPVAFMFIMFTIIFCVHFFRMSALEYNYEYIDNALTNSLLSAGIINLDEYAVSKNLLIQEGLIAKQNDEFVKETFDTFEYSLKNNLRLDEAGNIGSRHGVEGNIKIEEFRVYNVRKLEEGLQITEYVMSECGDILQVTVHDAGEAVVVKTTSENVAVKETSVFAKISFNLQLMGHTPMLEEHITEDMVKGRYTLSRLIGICER